MGRRELLAGTYMYMWGLYSYGAGSYFLGPNTTTSVELSNMFAAIRAIESVMRVVATLLSCNIGGENRINII